MSEEIRSYRDLIVWQKAVDLCVEAYRLSKKLPKEELYALSDQIRRAAVSVPSNIAEGHARHSRKDFAHFLRCFRVFRVIFCIGSLRMSG